MFGLFKKKNKENKRIADYNKNGEHQKSSIEIAKTGDRYMKLPDDACAIVMYNNDKVEVICTKMKSSEDPITANEMTLMAFAMMLKQPGFAEMLRNEFKNIAMDRLSMFNGEEGE